MIFIHSLILITLMLLLSLIIFILMFLSVLTIEAMFHSIHDNLLFSQIIFLTVFTGIIMHYFLKTFQNHFHFNMTSITMMEYYIQWTLIYVTIYQAMFDDLFKSSKQLVANISSRGMLVPEDLILVLFPALIATWVAIAIYKVHQKQI